MRRSLFPSDDSLPTWLHTLACLFVASFFGVPLLWWGVEAIHLRHLEPLSGPELGQYFFGSSALDGKAAVKAGWSLMLSGAFFLALGVRYTRAGELRPVLRYLPWVLLAVSTLIAISVTHHG